MARADAFSDAAIPVAGRDAAPAGRQAWLIVALWAAVAIASGIPGFDTVVDRLSTDDAMRLAEVRDLLAGQGWFDLSQYRLNPPDGVVMHWSRIIDLPIAIILGAFQAVLPADLALKLALVVWPALLLLPTLFACSSVCRTLAGPTAALLGPLMLVMSPGVLGRYAPANIDHHGAQLALALAMLACALKLDRSAWAAFGGGVCAAVMLAIGMETLPHVAAIAALVALRWGVEGAAIERGVRIFGLSFGLSTAAVAFVTLAPSSWSAPVCDALGVGHLVAALVGGIGLWAAASLARDDIFARFAALAAIGVLVLLSVALVSPACLGSPYANLPEQVKQGWLINVQEARPFFATVAIDPSTAAIVGLPLMTMLVIAAWAAMTVERDMRWPVATTVAVFLVSCGVTLWQVRGSGLAFAFGGVLLPMAAIAIGRTGEGRVRLTLAVMLLSPLTAALVGLGAAQAAGLPSPETVDPDKKICGADDYRALDRLTPGLALNTIDTGPFILAHTAHSVVAGPYHRDVDGIAASLDAFDGEEATARAVAVSRRASYVVVCVADGGARLSAKVYPGGFSEKLMSGAPFEWLQPVDLGAGARVKAWRVVTGRR